MADDKPANRKNGKPTPKAGATRADAAAETKVRNPQAKKDAVRATGTTSADRRAALREQQIREQQRARRNKQLKVGALVLAIAVLVGGIIWLAWWLSRPKATVAPVNQTADHSGVILNPGHAKPGAKKVQLYEDFQCPWCKTFDGYYMSTLEDLAKNGDINFETHMVTFLDKSNTSSKDAAVGFACVGNVAPDQAQSFFDTVFANQPQTEGTGYTQDQIRTAFPTQAGLSGDGLTKYQKCYDDRATQSWVTNADTQNQKQMTVASQAAKQDGIGTPTLLVNGKYQDLTALLKTQDVAGLKNLIDQAK